MNYHPSIWRTCRVLANEQRLACLLAVLRDPFSSVNEIAARLDLPLDKASLGLRALQARGLIQAQRVSRWVRYLPLPDPLVPDAAPTLAALRKALKQDAATPATTIRTLTAFTHPRRLALLRHLQQHKEASVKVLSSSNQISIPALHRHLLKLKTRALIVPTDQGWALSSKPPALAKDLLHILAHSPQ